MTKDEKSRYSEPEALRDISKEVFSGRKFRLDAVVPRVDQGIRSQSRRELSGDEA